MIDGLGSIGNLLSFVDRMAVVHFGTALIHLEMTTENNRSSPGLAYSEEGYNFYSKILKNPQILLFGVINRNLHFIILL